MKSKTKRQVLLELRECGVNRPAVFFVLYEADEEMSWPKIFEHITNRMREEKFPAKSKPHLHD